MRNIVSFSLSSLPTILRHRERCDHRRGISRKKETFRRHHEKSSSRATAWKIYFSSPINLHVFFPGREGKVVEKEKLFPFSDRVFANKTRHRREGRSEAKSACIKVVFHHLFALWICEDDTTWQTEWAPQCGRRGRKGASSPDSTETKFKLISTHKMLL